MTSPPSLPAATWLTPGPVGAELSAVPVLDEPARYGDARWQQDLPGGSRRGKLGSGDPQCLGDLLAVDGELGRRRASREAEHQARREGPRLAPEIGHVTDDDAHFLEHLAPHGLLDGLPGLDEA